MMRHVAVVILAVALAVSLPHVTREVLSYRRRAHTREAARTATLAYSRSVPLGLTRKDVESYLQARGTPFYMKCCDHQKGSYPILVQVGTEDPPWYCSAQIDYTIFEFKRTAPPEVMISEADSDILNEIHWIIDGQDCL